MSHHINDIQFAPMHLSHQEMENFYNIQKKCIAHGKRINTLF
jgi:hypothetical protein